MEPLLYSVAYYLIVFAFCELTRTAADQITPAGSLQRRFVYEIAGQLQVVSCIYENANVTKHYGLGGFFVAVLCLVFIHITINRGATVNPMANLEQWTYGKISTAMFLVVFVGEVIGSFLAFRLAMSVWWMRLTVEHAANYDAFACAIRHKVAYPIVVAYEFLGCFLIRFLLGKSKPQHKRYVAATLTASGLTLALYAIGTPGLNPANANRLFGCPGMSAPWFLATYWLFPTFGWMAAAAYTNRAVSKFD